MELKVEIICVKCNGKNLVKNGKSHSGEQRYLCKDCKRTQQKDYQRNGDKPEIKSLIKEMVHNGCGVRQTGRILKISKDTVTKYLKKNKIHTDKS